MSYAESLQRLPKVHTLLETAEARAFAAEFGRRTVADALRAEIAQARRDLISNGQVAKPLTNEGLLESLAARLQRADLSRLQRVINATGIVLHTNMGRAPMAAEAVRAAAEVSLEYSNLELDLATGKRGGRGRDAAALLQQLTGAEAALVVNNNAAAVLLALSTLASGAEVIISRGELVEIGGSFRIPDVIRASGATLVEVGTTNKTRLADYADAVTERTRVLLKVHPSNYRIVGFTGETSLADLAGLARERGLMAMQDLGSGALVDLTRYGLPHEPTVQESLGPGGRPGADVVTVSGDKLLGGPQCGIVLGRAEQVHAMGRHPLFRALRAGKMALAALEATLRLYLDDPAETVPALRMLIQSPAELLRRARRLRRALARIEGIQTRVESGAGFAGGGALPERELPTHLVKVRAAGMSAGRIADLLRTERPPIVGVVADESFVLDMRTLQDSEVVEIASAFARLFSTRSAGEMGAPP